MDMIVYMLVVITIGITMAREAQINIITGEVVTPIHPSDGVKYQEYLTVTQGLVKFIFNAVLLESWLQVARGLTVVMMGIRMLKPFSSHPKLAIVTRTLAVAMADLKYFFLIFLPMFFSYVISGHILFGATVKKFSSFSDTTLTCFNIILLGEHQWDDMYQPNSSIVNRVAAIIWFWSFLVLMFLIMLNILLAIVMDSYAVVKESMADEADDDKAIDLISSTFELIEDYIHWFVTSLTKRQKKKEVVPEEPAAEGEGEGEEEAGDVKYGKRGFTDMSLTKRVAKSFTSNTELLLARSVDVKMMMGAGASENQAITLLQLADEVFNVEPEDEDPDGLKDDMILKLQQNLFDKLTQNEEIEGKQQQQLNIAQVGAAVELLTLQLKKMEKKAMQ